MNLFEFFYFAVYLSMLTFFAIMIQVYNPGKQIRETLHPETIEKESESEEYIMTENPLFEKEKEGLRQRSVETETPLIEQVD